MKYPLEGLTVLDLSHALAGPYCSTLLADFGADVIKIEPPGGGEISRSWGFPLPGGEENEYFTSLHRNKKGIVLDLKHAEGKALLMRMIEQADVVLENFRPGTLDKMGLGYEQARECNPCIIYCSISGFGLDGPYRDRAGMDLIIQAESGMISVTGEAGGRGVRAGVSIADLTGGLNAMIGVLLALRVREKTGEGQSVDISMMEGQMSLLSTILGAYLVTGEVPGPMGTAYKPILPYQTFRTKSRDLALAVGTEKLWKDFCPAMGCPELANDPRYANNRARNQNRQTLIDRLQEILLTKTYEEWEAILADKGIPVGAINNMEELVNHPQVKARGSLVEVDHPRAGKIRMVGVPVRLSKTPGAIRTAAPLLGEHNDEVLRHMLGLSDDQIAALRQTGAFGAPP
ncbi:MULTISPECIES: CaiB/BaiF CoA transferase family protein [Alcaligenaceae]|uniref:CaiB/BaiF CoA transferase family protein n=1 Tax=Alcaligenaceae TaxID=506 RepID=UPI0005A450A8|nr:MULTISPECIES: CaiB/BaiF CoA-transferase family protein [Alcaligenaceae]CUJ31220.1 Formyl-coenzyme A transferase [Achromobacter xylosoxidans]CUJ71299.1 Formyl-coenzyme A transferase [Achromobacter xylosoxidans]